MSATFYLIRHGMVDPVGVFIAGRAPGIHLNDLGRHQVALLAQEFSEDPKLAGIYSSPLERTRETAQAIAEKQDLDVLIEPAFHELDYGDWTGKNFAELAGSPQWNLYNSGRSTTRIPGGETMIEAQSRAIQGLERLALAHDQGKLAIVSHGDVIRLILLYCLGMSIDLIHRLVIEPASVSVIRLGPGEVHLERMNALPGRP